MKINNKRTTHQIAIDLPQDIDPNYVKEALAVVLYYNGKISEKEARSLMGKTRRQFEEEMILQFGLSMIGGTKEDIEIEKQTCHLILTHEVSLN